MMSVHPIFILVSIWSGIIIFFSAVVAPTVFKSSIEIIVLYIIYKYIPKITSPMINVISFIITLMR